MLKIIIYIPQIREIEDLFPKSWKLWTWNLELGNFQKHGSVAGAVWTLKRVFWLLVCKFYRYPHSFSQCFTIMCSLKCSVLLRKLYQFLIKRTFFSVCSVTMEGLFDFSRSSVHPQSPPGLFHHKHKSEIPSGHLMCSAVVTFFEVIWLCTFNKGQK